ncbi:MAG: hypothetical protein JO166_06295 [Deltaproteobacteria bacterium]|nr:hypothetical protein [Deltaproteobacteria bacterium]
MRAKIIALAAVLMAAMSSAVMAQNPEELQQFNTFLDKHPELAQPLAADPRLSNNPHFIADHPGLQQFLGSHPGVRHSLQAAPGQFMYREGHYEWQRGGGPIAAAPGTASGPIARFDEGYLDKHPEVARQLSRNPALADNPQFLAAHPGLERYLAAHPAVRTELRSHPERFMTDEWRDEVYGGRGQGWRNQGGINSGELRKFDEGYLDHHPEVARQWRHNPALIDNPRFLAAHPGLERYLKSHPDVHVELQSNPKRFMSAE